MDKRKIALRLDQYTQIGVAPSHRPELGPCWVWEGRSNARGHGTVSCEGKNWLVHRLAYTAFVGEIPKDKEVSHLCRVKKCLNPRHLEAVVHRENVLRGDTLPAANVRKTHCVNGHEFTEENTLVRTGKKHRQRDCRVCMAERYARWIERNGPRKTKAKE